MLYLPPGSGYPLRVHGAYVSDDEVHRVVESLRQLGAPEYDEDILAGVGEDGSSGEGGDSDAESDPLYDQAVAIVTSSRKASISYVQRQLKVGYNRAARMIEEMERVGIVGPLQSNGSREVYAAAPPRD
jgi:S-DNA-T family DNA segregation ATPase FtsK/SpoIIIE